MKLFVKTILAACLAAFLAVPALAGDGVHKLVLQISDNDPQKMNTVLNVAANVARHYSSMGDEVDIKIVAFNQGLHMMRTDTSPVADRMKSFGQSMHNVEFQACNNTREAMAKKSGKEVPLFEFAEVVPAGVVSIMELDEQGYSVVRPQARRQQFIRPIERTDARLSGGIRFRWRKSFPHFFNRYSAEIALPIASAIP